LVSGPESIKKLIQELKKDDEDVEHKYVVTVPEEAIARLIESGNSAVEYLLPLLNHPNRYSCAYAVEILQAIGDKRAMEPLVKLLVDEDFADIADIYPQMERHRMSERPDLYEMLELALEKMGPSVMDPILLLSEKFPDHYWLPRVIAKTGSKLHDERAFQYTLKRAKPTNDMDDIEEYAETLSMFKDKRAIPVLAQLIGKDIRSNQMVLGALSEICDAESYRQILTTSGQETMQTTRRQVTSVVEKLEDAYKYPDKYQGEASREWEMYTRELRIQELVRDLIRSTATLGRLEKSLSETEQKALDDVAHKIDRRIDQLPQHYSLPKDIAERVGRRYYIYGKHKEERKYRGLDRLRDRIIVDSVEWLKSKDFKTVTVNEKAVWGWKGDDRSEPKGVYMHVYSSCTIMDWGDGWKEDEIKPFLDEFLTVVDKAARRKQLSSERDASQSKSD